MNSKSYFFSSIGLVSSLLILGACSKATQGNTSTASAKPTASSTAVANQSGSNVQVSSNSKIVESPDRALNDPTGYAYTCKGSIFNEITGDKTKDNLQPISLNVGNENITYKKILYQDSTHQILIENRKGKLLLTTLNGDEQHQRSDAEVNLGAKIIRMTAFDGSQTGENYNSSVRCERIAVPAAVAKAEADALAATRPTLTTSDNATMSVPASKPAAPTGPTLQSYSCTGKLTMADKGDPARQNSQDLAVNVSSDDVSQPHLLLYNQLYTVKLISNHGHVRLLVARRIGVAKNMGSADADFDATDVKFGIRNQEMYAWMACSRDSLSPAQ